MATNNNGYKRTFPRLGKCICCCCCSPKNAVITGAVIFLILYCFSFCSSILSINSPLMNYTLFLKILNYVSIVVLGCTIVSLILLIIGVNKPKISYLKPFKIVYLILIVVQIITSIYTYILLREPEYIKMATKYAIDSLKANGNFDNGSFQQMLDNLHMNEDEYYLLVYDQTRRSQYSSLVGTLIGIVILIYYYLTTCSYIEDLEEAEYEENDVRKLEDNQY